MTRSKKKIPFGTYVRKRSPLEQTVEEILELRKEQNKNRPSHLKYTTNKKKIRRAVQRVWREAQRQSQEATKAQETQTLHN